jgi:chromate transporter
MTGLQDFGTSGLRKPSSGLRKPSSGLRKPSSGLRKPSSGLPKYSLLFSTFFKIGAFTLGGGYAMIPIIEAEVVDKNKWIGKEDFLDLIAIAQSCPGVFAANIATFIGYRLKGTKGALCTTLGAVLPSFIIILIIAMVLRQFMSIHWIAAMFNGIRPAVVALIAVPTFNLAKSAKIGLNNVWIPIACAILICALNVNPIWVIVAAGLGGYLYGRFVLKN